jgi:hypothetical protein
MGGPPVPYHVGGAGARSCGTYIAGSGDFQFRAVYESWGYGFLSAANAAAYGRGVQVPYPDTAAFDLYMDNFCRQHPLETYADGVMQLRTGMFNTIH